MKKLTYLVSAIAAGLFTSAHADVSVSGSATLAYQSAGSDTKLQNGGAVSFDLSTTTDSGMTVSTSAGITLSASATGAGDTTSANGVGGVVTGWDNLTFATGGVTLTVGRDVGVPDGVGRVGGLVSGFTEINSDAITNETGLTDDEGAGVSISTSLGSAGLTVVYVANSDPLANAGDIADSGATGTGVELTTAMGDVGVTVGYATYSGPDGLVDTDDTETAAAVTYASSMGTISAGYTASTGALDGNQVCIAYSMDLDGATSLGIGYTSANVNDQSGRATDIVISRSLGGGMSVFAELRNTSGDVAPAEGENSTMAIGTSVSF